MTQNHKRTISIAVLALATLIALAYQGRLTNQISAHEPPSTTKTNTSTPSIDLEEPCQIAVYGNIYQEHSDASKTILIDALVSLGNSIEGGLTDENGNFEISNLAAPYEDLTPTENYFTVVSEEGELLKIKNSSVEVKNFNDEVVEPRHDRSNPENLELDCNTINSVDLTVGEPVAQAEAPPEYPTELPKEEIWPIKGLTFPDDYYDKQPTNP